MITENLPYSKEMASRSDCIALFSTTEEPLLPTILNRCGHQSVYFGSILFSCQFLTLTEGEGQCEPAGWDLGQ